MYNYFVYYWLHNAILVLNGRVKVIKQMKQKIIAIQK